jgi:hypothetical protein
MAKRKVEESVPQQPALPAWKAFVVQFDRATDSPSGTFAGRIEHLKSGRRAHFDSPDALLAIFGRLLADLGEPTK